MNFVVVKHPYCSTHYLFKCPENIKFSPLIDVVCETRYGKADGITVTPSFEVPENVIDNLCELYGTRKDDLRSVKSVIIRKDIDLDDSRSLEAFSRIFGNGEEAEEPEQKEDENAEEEEPLTDEDIDQICNTLHDILEKFYRS